MPCWEAEDTEDFCLVDHTDLNVGLIVESCSFVELVALDKQGTDGLIREQ